MGKIIRFWGYCVAYAWRGSLTLANAWQGLWGTVLLWAFGYWRKIPVAIPDKVDNYALLFLLASLGVTWLGVFLLQFLMAPATLYWEQRERADTLDQDLNAAIASQNEQDDEGPNWPIHEVFSHLEPDVLNPEHELWENVGDELSDALSLGRLRIWGRLYKTDIGNWVGERASLRPIDKTYWYKAYFTYMFFDETAGKAAHCYADRTTGVPAYTDLQVNRDDVLKLWPRELGAFADSYPNVRVADNPSIHEHILQGADRQKFLALLAQRKLSAWARPMQGSNDFVEIPANSWNEQNIDVNLNSGDSIINGVHRVHHQSYLRMKSGRREATHYDVALNRSQMRAIWPDLSFKLDDGDGA
jgi:hypothetical protein